MHTTNLHLKGPREVPCGQCTACRITRAKEWSIRMVHESFHHEHNIFVTLTYDDEHLPKNGEINTEETRNFIKRLRKHLGVNRRIKYFITGEYGKNDDRPHYHAIIFGLGLKEHKIKKTKNGWHILEGPVCKAWTKGYIQGGTVTPDSTRYVAEYIQKKLYKTEDGERKQPFATQSNGLGQAWYKKNQQYLKNNLAITFQGKRFPIPQYYIRKLELQDYLNNANRDYHKEIALHYKNKYDRWDITPAIRNHRIQTNKNLNAQQTQKERPL